MNTLVRKTLVGLAISLGIGVLILGAGLSKTEFSAYSKDNARWEVAITYWSLNPDANLYIEIDTWMIVARVTAQEIIQDGQILKKRLVKINQYWILDANLTPDGTLQEFLKRKK